MYHAEGAYLAGEDNDWTETEYLPEVTIEVSESDEPRISAENVDQTDAERVSRLQDVVDAIYEGRDIPDNGAPDSLYYNAPKHTEVIDQARKANIEAAQAMLGRALGFESESRVTAAISEADTAMNTLGSKGDDFVQARLSEQQRAGNPKA